MSLRNFKQNLTATEFTRSDRSQVWKKLDGAFKLVKEKKYGSSSKNSTNSERTRRRHNGLSSAIQKMQNSIDRDKRDIEFQKKRINTTDGQLEMQIRQAKLAMIEERIRSKEEKLKDMLKTHESIEKKLKKEEQKEAKAKVAAEKKEAPAAADTKSKAEIADQKASTTPNNNKSATKEGDQTTTPNQEKTQEEKVPEESVLTALGHTVGDSLVDVFDTVMAAAVVLGDKAENAIEQIIKKEEEE